MHNQIISVAVVLCGLISVSLLAATNMSIFGIISIGLIIDASIRVTYRPDYYLECYNDRTSFEPARLYLGQKKYTGEENMDWEII